MSHHAGSVSPQIRPQITRITTPTIDVITNTWNGPFLRAANPPLKSPLPQMAAESRAKLIPRMSVFINVTDYTFINR